MTGLTGKEKSHNHRITVQLLGSGWAAVELADYEDMDWNYDVVQTGIGRYATRDRAVLEAKEWAESHNIRLEVTEC